MSEVFKKFNRLENPTVLETNKVIKDTKLLLQELEKSQAFTRKMIEENKKYLEDAELYLKHLSKNGKKTKD